ncbi:hypothetical protein AVEN_21190-1 [Araneus ventricosus]|uniref:Uncharacterized protein n=1 Tax=Araneus ventricosus TaxID=182803 RepID=A0A4Y2MEX0_ARAVE|nr:hypothetical protein AVEN_21190-1 [Araneus ventricosus]
MSACFTLNQSSGIKHPPARVDLMFGEEVPSQVSSSSSDHSSKLRDLTLNDRNLNSKAEHGEKRGFGGKRIFGEKREFGEERSEEFATRRELYWLHAYGTFVT